MGRWAMQVLWLERWYLGRVRTPRRRGRPWSNHVSGVDLVDNTSVDAHG